MSYTEEAVESAVAGLAEHFAEVVFRVEKALQAGRRLDSDTDRLLRSLKLHPSDATQRAKNQAQIEAAREKARKRESRIQEAARREAVKAARAEAVRLGVDDGAMKEFLLTRAPWLADE